MRVLHISVKHDLTGLTEEILITSADSAALKEAAKTKHAPCLCAAERSIVESLIGKRLGSVRKPATLIAHREILSKAGYSDVRYKLEPSKFQYVLEYALGNMKCSLTATEVEL